MNLFEKLFPKKMVENASKEKNLRQTHKNENELYIKGLLGLFNEILNGKRESVIEGTLQRFVQLYQTCWNSDPAIRPTISEVIKTIEAILIDDPVEMIFILNLIYFNSIYYF